MAPQNPVSNHMLYIFYKICTATPPPLQAACVYPPFTLLYYCNCTFCCKVTELETEIKERNILETTSLQVPGDSGQTVNSM